MGSGAYISLAIYFIGMLLIGYYDYKKSTDSIEGYM